MSITVLAVFPDGTSVREQVGAWREACAIARHLHRAGAYVRFT